MGEKLFNQKVVGWFMFFVGLGFACVAGISLVKSIRGTDHNLNWFWFTLVPTAIFMFSGAILLSKKSVSA
jgi:hypothetical protein